MKGDEFFSEISKRPPFTKLHPKLGGFFRGYFSHEKAVRFGDQMVVNTHFPPYPSRAFDHLADGFRLLGDADERRLYSVSDSPGTLGGAARFLNQTASTVPGAGEHEVQLRGPRVQPMCILGLALFAFALSNSGCGKCQSDSDCDDGIFCNGVEVCGSMFGNFCVGGGNPCANPTPVCDEDQDTCHACTDDQSCDDGIACTDDFCNAATGECSHIENDAKCPVGHLCEVRTGCYRGECRSDEDCAPPTPRCGNTGRGPSCLECVADADCPTGQVCQYGRGCR